MHIRNSKERDRSAVMRIARKFASDIGFTDKRARFEDAIGTDKVIVACNDGDKPIGFLYSYLKGAGHHLYKPGRKELYVSAVAVDAAHHRQGAGHALLSELVASNRHRTIISNVQSSNAGGMALYKKNGFAESGNVVRLSRAGDPKELGLLSATKHLRPFEVLSYDEKHDVPGAGGVQREGDSEPQDAGCLKREADVADDVTKMSALEGGLAEDMEPEDFDEDALDAGIKIEMKEHTSDREVATRIAMDHLSEHPMYYDEEVGLPAFEKQLAEAENEDIDERPVEEKIDDTKPSADEALASKVADKQASVSKYAYAVTDFVDSMADIYNKQGKNRLDFSVSKDVLEPFFQETEEEQAVTTAYESGDLIKSFEDRGFTVKDDKSGNITISGLKSPVRTHEDYGDLPFSAQERVDDYKKREGGRKKTAGFFSWNCEVCGHPLLSQHVINDINAWMNDAVVILPDGEIMEGDYDGYGRIGGVDIPEEYKMASFKDGDGPQCYHRACWESVKKPTEYTGGSANAKDQGYFYEEGAHDMPIEDIGSIMASLAKSKALAKKIKAMDDPREQADFLDEADRLNTAPVHSDDIPRIDGTTDHIRTPLIPQDIRDVENLQSEVTDFEPVSATPREKKDGEPTFDKKEERQEELEAEEAQAEADAQAMADAVADSLDMGGEYDPASRDMPANAEQWEQGQASEDEDTSKDLSEEAQALEDDGIPDDAEGGAEGEEEAEGKAIRDEARSVDMVGDEEPPEASKPVDAPEEDDDEKYPKHPSKQMPPLDNTSGSSKGSKKITSSPKVEGHDHGFGKNDIRFAGSGSMAFNKDMVKAEQENITE